MLLIEHSEVTAFICLTISAALLWKILSIECVIWLKVLIVAMSFLTILVLLLAGAMLVMSVKPWIPL